MSTLFPLPADAVAVTSDDCYTPRWVFDAMGLRFDLDVACPVGGPWHVPCDRYFTAEDDGLAQMWDGLIWCNPPYSNFAPWAQRFMCHDRIALMGLMLNTVRWLGPVLAASDAVTLLPSIRFQAPKGSKPPAFRQVAFVAFRGVGTLPARQLARADGYGTVLYPGNGLGGVA